MEEMYTRSQMARRLAAGLPLGDRDAGFSFFFESFEANKCADWKRRFKDNTAEFSFPKEDPAIRFVIDWPYGCIGMYWDCRDEENRPPVRNPDFEPRQVVIEEYPELLELILTKCELYAQWTRHKAWLAREANPELERRRAVRAQEKRESKLIATAVNAGLVSKPKVKKKIASRAK